MMEVHWLKKVWTKNFIYDVANLVEDTKQDMINYAKYLEEQEREIIKNFLSLQLFLLVLFQGREVKFMSLGAMHYACCITKGIYCLKIWMFKAQFILISKDEESMHDVRVFTVRVYLKVWVSVFQAACAPYNDLLLKSLLEYSSIHSTISMSSHKFDNHLWCLS